MLDAHSVSFTGGTISLHDESGVPLRGLGIGSTRLLIAGLQRKAAAESTILLMDETEHGLEPHRIIRLLGSLGAKEDPPPLQVFMTTHSPVVLRELSGHQLFVVRRTEDEHDVRILGSKTIFKALSGYIRMPFSRRASLYAKGRSEVGLVRGLDQFRTAQGKESISACGVALVDCGGGDPDRPFRRAEAFQALGYRTAVLRDDDMKPTPAVEAAFIKGGGKVVAWWKDCALEDDLFLSLSDRIN